MQCLEEIQLTHSQKDFTGSNAVYDLSFILKLLSFCPVLTSIQVHENPIVFSGSGNLSFQTDNLSNWYLLNISNCIQTLSLNSSKLIPIEYQIAEFFTFLNILKQNCANLEILDLSQNNLHCLPGWQNHVAEFLPNLKALYNIAPMSMFTNQSNLQNETTVDLNVLPDRTIVRDGTRCICQFNDRQIALYTHPLFNRRLIRVPTGDRNNWCAIYALGLENNQYARNAIMKYNGAFIDAYDHSFWTQMAIILNSPIEIYRDLDFGRADSLNGTLELVARYGSGTEEPRRIFARFGHYNALLDGNDPDAIVTFMNNQINQGNLTF